jgi:putative Holliday junction resolvase
MHPTLAIDFGLKRIGLAISDSKGIISTPLTTLRFTKNRKILELITDLTELIAEYRVKSILIGVPQEFSDKNHINTVRITDFSNTLKKRIKIPILFWDESYSTSSAKEMVISHGSNFKSNKEKIDSIAASIFLQEYLNSKLEKNESNN